MNPIVAIREWLTDVAAPVPGTTSTDVATAETPPAEGSMSEESPSTGEGLSKAEIVVETGVTPEAYICSF